MVGSHDLVRVGFAPFSKRLAVKEIVKHPLTIVRLERAASKTGRCRHFHAANNLDKKEENACNFPRRI